jgi:GWxTD domain-containing protein
LPILNQTAFYDCLSNVMKNRIYPPMLLTILLIPVVLASWGQKAFIDENIGYWYNIHSDLHLEHQVFVNENTVHLLLDIRFNNGKIYDDYHFNYELHRSYHTLDIWKSDTIDIKDHIIGIEAGKVFVKLELPFDEKLDLAIFRMTDKKTGIDYVYDVPLIQDYNFSTDGLTLYEEDGTTPHLQPFVSINQPLILTSILPYFSAVHCFYYSHQFDEAVPPMVIEDQRAAKSLTIDSVFSVRLDEKFTLRKEGLYFFQKDSTTANGIAIRVQNEHYPLAKTFENVLAPLIYISTRSETDQIRSAPNQKEAFENYWIELVKIPKLASSTVRQYYEGVEGANFLFTSYKEGWKSDMGLIYTIYGPPNDVYKSEEIIDWVYNQDLTMPNIRFSFYRVKNVFSEHYYKLLRKKNYDKNWFKSVELWRKGKK